MSTQLKPKAFAALWKPVAALDQANWDLHVMKWTENNPRAHNESLSQWLDRCHRAVYLQLLPIPKSSTWDLFQYRWIHTGTPNDGESRHDFMVRAQYVFRVRMDAMTPRQKEQWHRELQAWQDKRESEQDAATAKRWETEMEQKGMVAYHPRPSHPSHVIFFPRTD